MHIAAAVRFLNSETLVFALMGVVLALSRGIYYYYPKSSALFHGIIHPSPIATTDVSSLCIGLRSDCQRTPLTLGRQFMTGFGEIIYIVKEEQTISTLDSQSLIA